LTCIRVSCKAFLSPSQLLGNESEITGLGLRDGESGAEKTKDKRCASSCCAQTSGFKSHKVVLTS